MPVNAVGFLILPLATRLLPVCVESENPVSAPGAGTRLTSRGSDCKLGGVLRTTYETSLLLLTLGFLQKTPRIQTKKQPPQNLMALGKIL